MITLEQAIAEQNNLEDLCCDRPLETQEIFFGNAFYGIDSIFKEYAGLPQATSLKVSIPHGINLSEEFVWDAEVNAPLPAIFYSSTHEYKSYVKALKTRGNWKLLTPFASPFLYIVELLKEQPKPLREGTLFFPSHSTHHVTSHMDFERLADNLVALPPEYHPVTICLYWKDFNLNRHVPFLQRGLSVVSAGHMFDPLFLFRFYHLCSTHKYAASNELGSHLFYSVKAGCSYFHFDTVQASYTAEDETILTRDCSETSNRIQQELKTVFQYPSTPARSEQIRLVDYYLGTQYFKTPEGLRQQLLQFESAYLLENQPESFLEIPDPEVLTQLNEIPSETSENERKFLYNFFSKVWNGEQSVCEIGPFLGGTTRAIALGMIQNPQRQETSKLLTIDRFEHYYSGEQLIQYLEPVFQKGLLDHRSKQELTGSSSFLQVFKQLHCDKPYFDVLLLSNQALPQTVEESDFSHFELPNELEVNAVFVDGCKSWYATKHFMLKICQSAKPGTYFFFQDYGWYTCFWIPIFLHLFKVHFQFITSVDSTYLFRLVEPLTPELIDQLYPDHPTALHKSQLDEAFSELIMAAQYQNHVSAMIMRTLQHGAALTYIGFITEAKLKLTNLVNQTWFKDYLPLFQAALKSPTYLPNGESIDLFTDEEIQQLITQSGYLNPYQTEIDQLQEKIQELQHQLERQLEVEAIATTSIPALAEPAVEAQPQVQVDQLQQVQRLQRRLKNTKAELQEATLKISAMESSKFWKIRNLWFQIKQTLGLKE